MPKRPPYAAGEYYHFYNRGRSRLSIFHDQRDYLDVLDKMKRNGWDIALGRWWIALLLRRTFRTRPRTNPSPSITCAIAGTRPGMNIWTNGNVACPAWQPRAERM